MNAHRAARKPEPDQKVLVLLAVGLLLLSGRLLPSSPGFLAQEPLRAPAYAWLTGAHIPEGLYRLGMSSAETDVLCATLGLPQASSLQDEVARRPAAFRLRAGGPPVSSTPPSRLAPLFFAPVAINAADRELLMTLPGIGPRLADAVIAWRQKKKIANFDELLKVNGLGKAKISKLKGLVSFD